MSVLFIIYCYGKVFGLTGQQFDEAVGLQVCKSSSIQKSTVSCLGDLTSGNLANRRYRMYVSIIDATYLTEIELVGYLLFAFHTFNKNNHIKRHVA